MPKPPDLDPADAQARLRFSIIGYLLAAPPARGKLDAALDVLSATTWHDPVTDAPVRFSKKTIERWYYEALAAGSDPVGKLRKKRRKDFGDQLVITEEVSVELRRIRKEYPTWSTQLVADELSAVLEGRADAAASPSYSSVRRFMKRNGLDRQRRRSRKREDLDRTQTPREVRRFEVDRTHALWHLDFHKGSRRILFNDGRYRVPILLCILDDHSRLICHAQWYLHEDKEDIVHGFSQALQRRGLPRALLTDNGSAMTSDEFCGGLARLGIVHETTLPYHPEQNGKQERFFSTLEGRLMPLLVKESDLTLSFLNLATHAWIEEEYHLTIQREMKASPRDRLLTSPDASRDCPTSEDLRRAFVREVTRKPSRETATISLDGIRFEIPPAYRHFDRLRVRYARWDRSIAWLVDQATGESKVAIRPEDANANADGKRRVVHAHDPHGFEQDNDDGDRPALLKKYLADYAATGLPPAYLPKPGEEES